MLKSFITAAVLTAAATGSVMLGGTALADCGPCGGGGGGGGNHGGNGTGGTAINDCLNVGVNALSGIGLIGNGNANGASCDATANGTGGSAR